MDSSAIQWLLFESRTALLVVLALVQFGLLWAWARWRTRTTRRLVVGGLLVACALLVVQALVVTDREKILAVCHQLAYAVEDGDIDRFGQHIATTFSADSIDRAALLAGLDRILERVQVDEPRLSGFEVFTDGARARATFQARCRLTTSDWMEAARLSRWELILIETADGWQVTEMRPIWTPSFPFRSLSEVIRPR